MGAIPGVYNFDINVAGYDVTDSLGAIYDINFSTRTTGASALSFGIPEIVLHEEGAMSGVLVAFSDNVIVNTFTVRVTGLAGKTINWRGLAEYIFVS